MQTNSNYPRRFGRGDRKPSRQQLNEIAERLTRTQRDQQVMVSGYRPKRAGSSVEIFPVRLDREYDDYNPSRYSWTEIKLGDSGWQVKEGGRSGSETNDFAVDARGLSGVAYGGTFNPLGFLAWLAEPTETGEPYVIVNRPTRRATAYSLETLSATGSHDHTYSSVTDCNNQHINSDPTVGLIVEGYRGTELNGINITVDPVAWRISTYGWVTINHDGSTGNDVYYASTLQTTCRQSAWDATSKTWGAWGAWGVSSAGVTYVSDRLATTSNYISGYYKQVPFHYERMFFPTVGYRFQFRLTTVISQFTAILSAQIGHRISVQEVM